MLTFFARPVTFCKRSTDHLVDEEVLEAGLLDEGVEGGHGGRADVSLAVRKCSHHGRQQLRYLEDKKISKRQQ